MPPTMLIDALNAVRRRVKVLSVAFGAGVVLAAAALAIPVLVLIDWACHYLVVDLTGVPRLVLLLITLAALGWAAARLVINPVLARLSLGDVAGRLEQAFPAFDDRLRSTVGFLDGDVPGSAVMKDRVITQATDMARRLDLNRAIVLKPVWYSVISAVAALALVVGLSLIDADFTQTAFSRLLHPFGGRAWPKLVQMQIEGLPDRVPAGKDIDVRGRLLRGAKPGAKVILHYRYDNGPAAAPEELSVNADGTFARVSPLKAQGHQLTVWLESGDDSVPAKEIVIVPLLEIQSLIAAITPPAYTGLGPQEPVNLLNKRAVMAVGSTVELRASFSKDLDSSVEPTTKADRMGGSPKAPPPLRWERVGKRQLVARFAPAASFRFRLQATDLDGYTNGARTHDVEVIADENPRVTLDSPRDRVNSTAVGVVRVQITAEADFALRSSKLLLERTSDKSQWELDLGGWQPIGGRATSAYRSSADSARKAWHLEYELDLRQLAPVAARGDRPAAGTNPAAGPAATAAPADAAVLNPGDLLEGRVRVEDNFGVLSYDTLGVPRMIVHPPAYSADKLRVLILSQEELSKIAEQKVAEIARKTEEVKTGQDNTAKVTAALRDELKDPKAKDKGVLSNGQKDAADRLTGQQSNLVSRAKNLAQDMGDVEQLLKDNRSTDAGLGKKVGEAKRQLDQAADNPMKDAAGELGQAAQQKADKSSRPGEQQRAAGQRDEQLAQAQADQAEGSRQLDNALHTMGQSGNVESFKKKFEQLLGQQQDMNKEFKEVSKDTFGKKPEELTKEQRDKLEAVAKKQEEAANQTNQTTADMQKAAQQMEKSDPSASDSMKQAAQQAQAQNIGGNQKNAGDEARKNNKRPTQSAQEQAELGLRVVLDKLKDADRRKLEKLRQKLEDVAKNIENLIRRQAGHNVDDLAIQGKIAQLTAELLKKADRPVEVAKLPPAPKPGQLTAGQQLTERNTRRLSQDLNDVPDGAEITRALIKAYRKMGDALGELDEQKLDAAYDPNMVDALASLEDARRRAAEQQKQVKKEQDRQKREVIREAYIEVKKQQDQVNKDTTQVDKTDRLPDGELKRNAIPRLNQLLGIEGSLAERCKKLGDDLAALDSVVYTWANQDIIHSMDEVKDDLGKRATGEPTQAEQARISEQLVAMIENLAQLPPDKSDFDQKGGGGGGDGGAPPKKKLPPEVELRLMKDLQVAVNKSTTKINDLPKEKQGKEKLVSLGKRQGELRRLLNDLLTKASGGKMTLGPEPRDDQPLPEEASNEQIENQETDKSLLLDDEKKIEDKADKDMSLIGDRMARVKTRLGEQADPGKTTQKIEERIVSNLDDLIALARAQNRVSNTPSPGDPQPGDGPPQPADASKQPGNSNGEQKGEPQLSQSTSPADSDSASGGDENGVSMNPELERKPPEWGQVFPGRVRDAVIEGASDQIISKYKKQVEDYYRTLSIKANERRRGG